jgi:hypothetical protein
MSGGGGVTIPVSVTGSDEAKAKLGQVGGAVHQVQDAGAGAHEQNKKLTEGFGSGGEVLEHFHRKAERLAVMTLGSMNPALGETAHILFLLNDGLFKINSSMLMLLGAGVGVGAIVAMFEHWAEAAKELAAAEKERFDRMNEGRDKVLSLTEKTAQAGLKLGVTGVDSIVTEAAKLAAGGVPTDWGISTGLAEALSGEGFDRQKFLRGLAMTGGDAELGKDPAEAKKRIAAILRAGEADDSHAALDAFIRDVADSSRRDAVAQRDVPRDRRVDRFETIMAELKKEHPEIGERDEALIRNLMMRGDPGSKGAIQRVLFEAAGFEGRWLTPALFSEENLERGKRWEGLRPTGSHLMNRQLVDLAMEAQRRFDAEGGADGGDASRVHQVFHIENNATKIQPGDTRRRYSPDQELAPAMP